MDSVMNIMSAYYFSPSLRRVDISNEIMKSSYVDDTYLPNGELGDKGISVSSYTEDGSVDIEVF